MIPIGYDSYFPLIEFSLETFSRHQDSDDEQNLADLSLKPKVEVWHAHSSFKDDQGDCLSFERGDQIEIHRKYSNGWWSGRALNDENPILTWIPSNYLQEVIPV